MKKITLIGFLLSSSGIFSQENNSSGTDIWSGESFSTSQKITIHVGSVSVNGTITKKNVQENGLLDLVMTFDPNQDGLIKYIYEKTRPNYKEGDCTIFLVADNHTPTQAQVLEYFKSRNQMCECEGKTEITFRKKKKTCVCPKTQIGKAFVIQSKYLVSQDKSFVELIDLVPAEVVKQ